MKMVFEVVKIRINETVLHVLAQTTCDPPKRSTTAKD